MDNVPFSAIEGSPVWARQVAVLHQLFSFRWRWYEPVGQDELDFCYILQCGGWVNRNLTDPLRKWQYQFTERGYQGARSYFDEHERTGMAKEEAATVNQRPNWWQQTYPIVSSVSTSQTYDLTGGPPPNKKDPEMKQLYRIAAVFHPTAEQRAGDDENLQDDQVVVEPETRLFSSRKAARDYMVRSLPEAYAEVTDQIVFTAQNFEVTADICP